MTSPQPPAWAQHLVALLVPALRRDGVLGDLLEEYRETQLPARGPRRADAWYLRQVCGFVWRACVPWGLLLSSMILARDVFDIMRPTADFHVRAAVLTYSTIAVFAMGGFVAGLRARLIPAGAVLGFSAALICCAIVTTYAVLEDVLVFPLLSANPVYKPLIQTADLPIVPIIILGTLAGSIGGAIGRTVTRAPTRVDRARGRQ